MAHPGDIISRLTDPFRGLSFFLSSFLSSQTPQQQQQQQSSTLSHSLSLSHTDTDTDIVLLRIASAAQLKAKLFFLQVSLSVSVVLLTSLTHSALPPPRPPKWPLFDRPPASWQRHGLSSIPRCSRDPMPLSTRSPKQPKLPQIPLLSPQNPRPRPPANPPLLQMRS